LPYPVEETARQIRESGIPDYYAAFLKNENVLIL
ncbi:MAG TPA: metallophosphatase family protein, partial [Chryseobacterium indologenes]|nr:metallophosphatase family protein [Chryseobacterium indologenes]